MLKLIKKVIKLVPGVEFILNGIRYNIGFIRRQGLKIFFIRHWLLSNAAVRVYLKRGRYRLLSADQIRATRKSDRVFVFGSGYSLNDISPEEWAHIAEHDTLGLSGFIYQKWVRTDYHLIRGWVETSEGLSGWKKFTPDFAETLEANPLFRDTILVMQGDYSAQFCNQLLGYRYLRAGRKVFRYKTVRYNGPPTTRLEDGLRHAVGGMCDAVNFAFCMGWKEIVLTGVDLYDTRYFWLPPDKTLGYDPEKKILVASDSTVRGIRYDQTHSTAGNDFVNIMGNWADCMNKSGVVVRVYNPKSLLTNVLPLHENIVQNGCNVES